MAAAVNATKPRKKNRHIQYIRNLFFLRRRPKVLFPREWERLSDEAYWEQMHWEGFISPAHWKEDKLENYPLIMQDIRDLDEHLLPVFWRYNQISRYYQNRFYLYQWIFMLGTFVTTIFAVGTTQVDASNQAGHTLFTLSVATTIISAITSYFTLLSNQSNPRKRWANYRRLTEELRMTYFKYIARLEPFDKPDRVNQMRTQVMEIRAKERGNE